MFIAERPGTPWIGRGVSMSGWPNISSRFDAGSVLTSNTRFLASARTIAVAQANDVFPTPPFPVKNSCGGGAIRSLRGGADMAGLLSWAVASVIVPKCVRPFGHDVRSSRRQQDPKGNSQFPLTLQTRRPSRVGVKVLFAMALAVWPPYPQQFGA